MESMKSIPSILSIPSIPPPQHPRFRALGVPIPAAPWYTRAREQEASAPSLSGLARSDGANDQGNPNPAVTPGRWCMTDRTQRFSYRSLAELTADIARRGFELPTTDDVSILASPVAFGRLTVPNRFVVQPMEGCDAAPDGAPSDLTVRKYRRFAAGGSGMLWWEATAVVPQGRANPRQLWLTEQTLPAFAEMIRQTKSAARESVGYEPVCILQMTHSGRYSRPGPRPAPIIAHHSAVLDPKHNLPPDYPLITDEQLDALQDDFVRTAELAARAGFDGVDIKSCHRYLLSELLASFTRENSRYGGSFENRTRMLRETARKVRDAVGDRIEVSARMNAYDAIPRPWGWGVSEQHAGTPDLSEPIALIRQLREIGFPGINLTIGNPYFNPHVNRPADWMIAGWGDAPEHPLVGVNRIMHVVREVQQAMGSDFPVVGSGYTWMRQYMPNFAAAFVQQGWVSLVGVGRGALAYPDFARDIVRSGRMDRHKVCVVCSSCTQIMRDGGTSGCVVRDREVYGPIFREGRRNDRDTLRQLAARCRQCPDAMCVTRCPAAVDIPGFLGALADGRDRDAYDLLRARNPLPGICGSVCPVEVQCQSACIQNCLSDGPVEIGEIQRNLSRRAVREGWARLDLPETTTGKRIAILGAGPAGLAAAIELLRRGHRVTLFDRAHRAGGKVGGVIPPTRLSDSDTQAEIHAILHSVPPDRLQWRFGEGLGAERTLDDVMREGFDAAVLAFGLGNAAGLTGETPQGVLDANAFLQHMHNNVEHTVPPRVAVIGGGNTAMDAAVCAQTRGATDVFLLYRRSYPQMPAWPKERDEALHAGVHFLLLTQPSGYETDASGHLTAVRAVRTELGEPRSDGRRSPVEVPGSEFTLPVDLVIEAMGERVDAELAGVLGGVELTRSGLVVADPDTLATTREGVWAAGDIVNGGTTVVRAVADGRRAAASIDACL